MTDYGNEQTRSGLEHLFAIERKSIPDLCACCVGANRERFQRELHRLRGFYFKRLLIVGREDDIYPGRYHSSVTPKAVFATLNGEVAQLPRKGGTP
jgi:ERCC4-type nuclease